MRFIIPLAVALALIALVVVPYADALALRWFKRDLEIRGKVVANAMHDSLMQLEISPSVERAERLFNRVTEDERLFAVGFCNPDKKLIFKSEKFLADIACEEAGAGSLSRIIETKAGKLHIGTHPVIDEDSYLGSLVIVHDMAYVLKRSADARAYIIYIFGALATILSAITVLVAQMSMRSWINSLRSLLKGGRLQAPTRKLQTPELRPIVKDLRNLVRELETERRSREDAHEAWSPATLKDILNTDLKGDEVLVVSNREPYIHVRRGEKIEIQFPASGVVTALEPIMRACEGTWIAHGSGDADAEVVDANDRVRVPPLKPAYNLRRVWLSKEEEQGYYYGFANEGLWALCHIAHVRPTFKSQDWAQYVKVNEKFADAVVQEAKTDDPIVMVQDYHLALMPAMVRKRLPKATVITFWHIPFPNPEVFGICPWRQELLEGLLGSSILAFHTRFHCNNFIDTVDRFLESRIDREDSKISHKGNLTMVKSYPISIEYPVKWLEDAPPVPECRAKIRKENQIAPDRLIGLGVDRLDYTKGILERFMAVERLLELYPQWIGKFSFVQISAPSRTTIEQYQHFDAAVRRLASRINQRFGKDGYEPICLRIRHHEPNEVYEYYRGADLCFVSSLHDGMNLVAKEFIAARDDERGVLILSQFTGASRELSEALIVNPYHIDQCATALHMALEMPAEEQRTRIQYMRKLIQEFNVYRWAGKMLLEAARMRQRSRLLGDFLDRPLDGQQIIL